MPQNRTDKVKNRTDKVQSRTDKVQNRTNKVKNRTNKLFSSVQKVRFLEPLIQWSALFCQPCALMALKSLYAPIKYYRAHALGFFNIPYRAKWSV